MFLLRCCSRLPLSCLLFAAAVSLRGFGQSSAPQNKAPVVTPPTATKQWTGDLDVLLQHQIIRIGVPYSKTLYYTVKGSPFCGLIVISGILTVQRSCGQCHLEPRWENAFPCVGLHLCFTHSLEELV